MGQKVHPYGFRVGVTRPWTSRWYARRKDYGTYVVEDQKIKKALASLEPICDSVYVLGSFPLATPAEE